MFFRGKNIIPNVNNQIISTSDLFAYFVKIFNRKNLLNKKNKIDGEAIDLGT